MFWAGLWAATARAQGALPPSQPITYQGFLTEDGQPADGEYDFSFTLFPTLTGGAPITTTIQVSDVTVTDGVFTVALDFGADVFTGEPRYLEILVRPGTGGNFTQLAPRQQLTPAPSALSLPGLWTRPYSVSVNLIGGYPGNVISPTVIGGVIGGGGEPAGIQAGPNQVWANFGVVGGGTLNTTGGILAFLGGGVGNRADGVSSVIGGGRFNSTNDTSGIAVIAGGQGNQMNSGVLGFIGGGLGNEIRGNNNSVIGGGDNNLVTDNYGVIGGGSLNVAGNSSTLPFDAEGATVPGGVNNHATAAYSFAAGHNARADDAGAFVWADNSGGLFESTAANQVRFRATGGYQIDTNGAGAGVKLDNGDTAWEVLSDRAAKTGLRQVDGLALLNALAAMPISQWRYLWEEPEMRHIGPMAQDFYAAFGLGDDERYISTLDADGVALAAIQALYGLVQEQAAQIEALEQQNAELVDRLETLEGQ
jgi:hypothetical protein